MSSITLELIAGAGTAYSAQRFVSVDVVNHIHKRLERFNYLDDLKPHAVALNYFESPRLDSKYNLSITDRSYQVPANTALLADLKACVDTSETNSYSSVYSNILATNITFIDQRNQEKPLFYKHVLPTGTVSVQLEVVTNGNLTIEGEGYLLDLDAGYIYTNYFNFFDQETGAYKLYFITTTSETGTQTKNLLTPEPVVQEASWEDIDIETGELVAGRSVFTKERNTSGYTFYFNVDGPWWIKPQESSLIQCRYPIGRNATNAWHVRVTNGDVTSVVNSALRQYFVPEYLTQPYQPAFPYIFSSYGDALYVSSRVLAVTRNSLAIRPDLARHLTVYISDFEDNLLRVWTTDITLEGKRYSNTSVFYESDKVVCWDNSSGLIVFAEDLLPSWQFKAQFYYSADDLEYTQLDLNPVRNSQLLKQTVVLYLVPNVGLEERAVHHLLVEQDGTISYTSQSKTTSYPNLQLLNSDNSYNPDTVIGLKYISDFDTDTFITRYTAGFENDYAYMILAEVNVIDKTSVSEAASYDVRERGDRLVSDTEDMFAKNPKALYSDYGYGSDGQRLPINNTLVVQIPLTLLKDYGGVLSENQAIDYARKFIPAGTYPLIDWVYPYTEVSIDSLSPGQVGITGSWEGPQYVYKLYRKFALVDEWSLVAESIPASEESFLYIDTDVESGDTVYYELRLEDQVEFPAKQSFNIKVA